MPHARELDPYTDARATSLCEYAPMLVPGVLQTEAYARALTRASCTRPLCGCRWGAPRSWPGSSAISRAGLVRFRES